ncbi:SDR family NAD(P)-dependent oxidoreductase [Streptomyces griseorubiginosus]|uniref:SDR family NAD(P)-dependent oxidoreductase n=1 Tax=Streptomyces griseorubiginosus TaxID=67304 RepID=UPI002E8114C2|nr:SDR family NAD(P)-dependent oxidoreductase [Streptomyces griseorubiginosus]WUB41839.1 SDR family oxidoreductase [Streptomyces griseorubiginosus]WUB50359.1 SDR family oxidoreductase [Streptomyces griseorubiginosus]
MGGEHTRRFDGRIALVTGAGSGIGAAVARRLAAQGAEVFAVDLDGPAVDAVAKELPHGHALTVDVAEPAQVDRAFEEVVRRHGRLDVVVHAAGVDDPVAKEWIAEALVADRPPEVTGRLGDDAWRRVMRVNLDGTFHVLRAALRVMVPRRAGAVVTVGSSSAFDAQAGYPHYAASKAGAHALSQSVAKEAIAYGVRVNTVAPGPTETGMAARTPAALRQGFADPRVRAYATPEEIADVALFLASDEAANLVGAVVLANGGRFTV